MAVNPDELANALREAGFYHDNRSAIDAAYQADKGILSKADEEWLKRMQIGGECREEGRGRESKGKGR